MHPSELTLSDYVDRTLNRDEQAMVARHLETCDTCRAFVDDLREIARAASSLDTAVPPGRVWTRIEQDLRRDPAPGRPRGLSPGWTWLAAAAVLVLAVYIGVRFTPSTATGGGQESDAAVAAAEIEAELQLAEQHYLKAISGLERIASEGDQDAFGAETAATLQKNLAVINQAIDESRAAVRAEPASERAQYSLIENFRTKLALLQDTVAIINELRAGNDAAAARIVSGS
jgi:hypothetical protein